MLMNKTGVAIVFPKESAAPVERVVSEVGYANKQNAAAGALAPTAAIVTSSYCLP